MGEAREDAAGLVLAPSSTRGWFGGRGLVASGPTETRSDLTLAQAAIYLEEAFEGVQPGLTAVLARYDGSCTVVRFGVVEELGDLAPPQGPLSLPETPLLLDAGWDLLGREFRGAVERTRERIAAGDVYVLNLTARLTGRPVASPAELFSALVERAGSEMSALVERWPGATPWIASVSPERFLRVGRGEHGARLVEVCPIKGTRPRGATRSADRALAQALADDPKELAEHLMVVDLERNDLGVCAVPGTVRVEPLYEVVPTPYCHQLVSSVHSTLRPEATFAELLEAAFPCGSVTGAPKRAAIRIASELERTPRGAYCGALLVAMKDELDSSVLIRTLEGVADNPEIARWGAGCGITHDSDPAAEYLEMLLKATPVTGNGAPPVALRETMRVGYGRVAWLDRHLARLASGGTGPKILARVRLAVAEQLAAYDSGAEYGRLGVTVTPDGEVAAGITSQRSSLEVEGGPVIVPIQVAEHLILPPGAAKPASRMYWDRVHRAAEIQGGHQALLVDAEGSLLDGSTATVWLLHGDTLSTPPSPPAVAGVAREVVFDRAPAHGLTPIERALTLEDYESADEVFVSNAVGGLVRARRGASAAPRV